MSKIQRYDLQGMAGRSVIGVDEEELDELEAENKNLKEALKYTLDRLRDYNIFIPEFLKLTRIDNNSTLKQSADKLVGYYTEQVQEEKE